jgi:hypothetical protein
LFTFPTNGTAKNFLDFGIFGSIVNARCKSSADNKPKLTRSILPSTNGKKEDNQSNDKFN